jgi:GPH family glycoside/pentoside/hexuronide:cation symporter
MGWAVGGALAGFLLTIIGFVANIAQNEATLSGIRNMMSTIPAAIALVVIVITLFYELNDKLEKQIGSELEARKASAS